MFDTPAPATHYQFCEGVLGKGAYGTVVKAVNVHTKECFAVKCFEVTNEQVRTKPSARACGRGGSGAHAESAEEKLDTRVPGADTLGVHRCRRTSCARLKR